MSSSDEPQGGAFKCGWQNNPQCHALEKSLLRDFKAALETLNDIQRVTIVCCGLL